MAYIRYDYIYLFVQSTLNTRHISISVNYVYPSKFVEPYFDFEFNTRYSSITDNNSITNTRPSIAINLLKYSPDIEVEIAWSRKYPVGEG